jgi:nucleotide-binding universal stress UspA family protein
MGAELARATRSGLTFVHVVPARNSADHTGAFTDAAPFEHLYEEYAQKMLAQAQASLQGQEIAVDCLVLRGAPAEAVADAAQASDVDLVIVGSRGLGAVKRALLGSVSDRLLHICPKPVLVVR